MVLDFDLNELPAEGRQIKDYAASIHLQHKKMTNLGSPGSFSAPIDADAIVDDDDVILLPSSSWVAPSKSRSRRKRPVTFVIDEILETDTWQSGDVEEQLTLSLSIKKLHTQNSLGKTIIDCDLDVGENCHVKMNEGTKHNPDTQREDSAPPKELTLACAVCLDSLKEASSTICGHLFCRMCIEAAISKQKMCPICRRKLTKKNYHRIYFPKAQGICFS